MSRTAVEWRSSSKENYKDFVKKNPTIKVGFDEWKNIVYSFNESFKEHILETGERIKMPFGFGEFSIRKKKRNKTKIVNGKEYINLPIDWVKSRAKGKRIYFFNYHTEGYFFGWTWFNKTARFKFANLWRYSPTRSSSRLLAHYIKTDNKYQNIYREYTLN